jgi:hypothetical protein
MHVCIMLLQQDRVASDGAGRQSTLQGRSVIRMEVLGAVRVYACAVKSRRCFMMHTLASSKWRRPEMLFRLLLPDLVNHIAAV